MRTMTTTEARFIGSARAAIRRATHAIYDAIAVLPGTPFGERRALLVGAATAARGLIADVRWLSASLAEADDVLHMASLSNHPEVVRRLPDADVAEHLLVCLRALNRARGELTHAVGAPMLDRAIASAIEPAADILAEYYYDEDGGCDGQRAMAACRAARRVHGLLADVLTRDPRLAVLVAPLQFLVRFPDSPVPDSYEESRIGTSTAMQTYLHLIRSLVHIRTSL